MSEKVLISGISGQDGSYLSEFLIEEGYEVYGLVRRHSVAEDQSTRLEPFYSDLKKVFYADLLDEHSLYRVMEEVKPDIVYNLAAMSHVRISFDVPAFTIKTNALGVLNMLEVVRTVVPKAKFYQASSSEMFGNSEEKQQNETTRFKPQSPYATAKVLAYWTTKNYRDNHKIFASN